MTRRLCSLPRQPAPRFAPGLLVQGRRYVVRVRLRSTSGSGETAVMCW
ncbi:hypothetical protein [Streptomyces sp. NPDC052107]